MKFLSHVRRSDSFLFHRFKHHVSLTDDETDSSTPTDRLKTITMQKSRFADVFYGGFSHHVPFVFLYHFGHFKKNFIFSQSIHYLNAISNNCTETNFTNPTPMFPWKVVLKSTRSVCEPSWLPLGSGFTERSHGSAGGWIPITRPSRRIRRHGWSQFLRILRKHEEW